MDSLGNLLISNAAIAGVLALFVCGITGWWRNPHLAHALWLVVLLKLVTPAFVTIPLPQLTVSTDRTTEGPHVESDFLAQNVAQAKRLTTVDTDIALTQAIENWRPRTDQDNSRKYAELIWSVIMFVVWPGGAVVSAFITAGKCIAFRRLFTVATDADEMLVADVQRLANKLKLRRHPDVQFVDARIPPLVWSGIQPRILLPRQFFTTLDHAQQQAVLVHELAHIRRRDHLVRWLETAVLVLFWWYPVAWWASRQMRQAEEECCDASVVSLLPANRRSYGIALSQAVEFLTESYSLPALAGTAFGSFSLKRRIEMIVRQDVNQHMSWAVLSLVLLLAACVLPVVAQTSPGTPASPKPTAEPQPKTENEDKIEAGVGWKAFHVGASRKELIDAFGRPDPASTERHLQWKEGPRIHCLIDDERGAFELRFDAGFQGQLTSGIQIGSDAKSVAQAYGLPDAVSERGSGKKYIYMKEGVLFWTKADKVTQIVIFRAAR